MIYAWDIVSEILKNTAALVEPGITTGELDAFAEKEMNRLGAKSTNKGYKPERVKIPFPTVSCISVNNEIAHGIPGDRVLMEGDLVNIDMGVIAKDGQCGDAALSVPVGKISSQDQSLLQYAKSTLYAGIAVIRNGCTVGDIARACELQAGKRNFVANRQLVGHGIGKELHMLPNIHFTTNKNNPNSPAWGKYQKELDHVLTTGMIICLEPCLTFRDPYGFVNPVTGWQHYTADGKKSAMFEHMVRVLDDGAEILTTHIKSYREEEADRHKS